MARAMYAPRPELVYVTEDDVRRVVGEIVDNYEEKTAGPRYLAMDGKLSKILSFMDKASGAFVAIKNLLRSIGWTLTVLYSVLKIVEFWRGNR